jgi:rRNA-processing protein FCF1
MNLAKINRYYEVKQKLKELQAEEKQLNEEIKEEMLKNNLKEAAAGKYQLQLQRHDRSEMDASIVNYFRETGHEELLVETYDHELFKELEKRGVFDTAVLQKYRREKIVYVLLVKLL